MIAKEAPKLIILSVSQIWTNCACQSVNNASRIDIIATALREAQEEIDLDPIDVQVVGTLNQVISRYGFLVTPVLAIVPEQVALSTDSHEIDAIFKVPLSFFLDGEPDQIDHQHHRSIGGCLVYKLNRSGGKSRHA